MSQYVGIRSEGALIPLDLLDRIAQEQEPGQQAKDFGLAPTARLTDEIARAWGDAQDYWHIFQRRSATLDPNDSGTTITREKWMQPLLSDLGYTLTFQPAGAQVGGRTYPISHRAGAGEESPPVHIEGRNVSLDERQPGRRLSPQALVQEYLNVTDEHLWGVVTNGLRLRLLRDTSRTSRPSYLEFDLESIVEGNHFNEFILFYRLCHRSRLPKTKEDSTSCWLEKYFQEGVEQGGRVRNKLRDGVEEALTIIGRGLLRNPDNAELRERVQSGRLTAAEMHRQLLRLVYRLLFLMVAEERHMIVPESPQAERRQRLYDRYYSVGRLRELAEKTVESSSFCDLWVGLQRTFALFEDTNDSNALGIPPLNGDLFGPLAIRDIQNTSLSNDELIVAIRRLSLFREDSAWRRINYKDLNVEELGSVYESLLDFQPVIKTHSDGMTFTLATGSERKSTGSYYTRPELVRELIESALVPVMEERLKQAKEKDAKEKALLSMTVCDPACGSGHFLLAAARRLGRELAKVRTGEDEPTPEQFHLAVRDVISHCIYGVDVNPLAVDLCKLALWLEGHWTGKPLSFLDHRIKCGNSLIGVLDPKVLKDGIPDAAFTAVTGDDKEVVKAFKKRNKEERKEQYTLSFEPSEDVHRFAASSHELDSIAEESPADVKRKQQKYEEWRSKPDWWHDWTACNIWTAAFFVPLTKFDDPSVPTHDRFLRFVEKRDSQPQMAAAANALGEELHFFHWRLEFPQVFEKAGFDVVLGNPPWERLRLGEEEHWLDDTYIAKAPKKQRAERLQEYRIHGTPQQKQRMAQFEAAKHLSEAEGDYTRLSGRYPLTGAGDVNTYALFSELSRQLLAPTARVGIIVQSSIATDSGSSKFFGDLVQKRRLVSLFDFVNLEGFFPGIHKTHPHFCALTMASDENPGNAQFSFYLTRTDQLPDHRRRFALSPSELRSINPNTGTCPVFRSYADAEVTKKLYGEDHVLVNEAKSLDPWGVYYVRLVHPGDHASYLKFYWEADQSSDRLVYEAKLFWNYDHRFATFEGVSRDDCVNGRPRQSQVEEKQNAQYEVITRYWVGSGFADQLHSKYPQYTNRWWIAWRDITNATNERTCVVAILPKLLTSVEACVLGFDVEQNGTLLAANLNSIVLDYAARQKLGGMHLNYYILKQLPVIAPASYSAEDTAFIAERVVRLTYTSEDLRPFAESLGYVSNPYQWNDEGRAQDRCDLDAYYAHLYGLTRDEVRYILDPKGVFGEDFPSETFRVLKDREIKEYGEYRTQRLVLEAFDKLAESPRFRDEMPNRVSAFEVPKKQSAAAN